MLPILLVAGKRKSGKTTLIENLIPVFVKKGYRVATIKHDVHGFEIDIPGKDTFRHREAGARITIISSPDKVAMVEQRDKELDFEEILERFIEDVDLVIAEGYKSHPYPKIEVYDGKERILEGDENLIAVVGRNIKDEKIAVFDPEDYERIAEYVEEKVIKPYQKTNLWLFINDRYVPLKDFIRTMFTEIISGMLKALKKVGEPKKVVIKVWWK